MNTLIQTETSFFKSIPVSWDELLKNCHEQALPLLQSNPKIFVFGRECVQHRRIAFFSNESAGYKYSNQIATSQPLTAELQLLLQKVNESIGACFNGILVNYYADGNDYIGKHSDDEKTLDKFGVVCISFGTPRKFRIRSKVDGKIVIDIQTTSQELWIMGGDFQQEFTHEVPIEKKIKTSRMSFTFRKHFE